MDMTATRKLQSIQSFFFAQYLSGGKTLYSENVVSIWTINWLLVFSMYAVHNADEVNSIYKEANSIKKLKHKNIVELYHAFVEGKQLIMIMELAKGGELMQYV